MGVIHGCRILYYRGDSHVSQHGACQTGTRLVEYNYCLYTRGGQNLLHPVCWILIHTLISTFTSCIASFPGTLVHQIKHLGPVKTKQALGHVEYEFWSIVNHSIQYSPANVLRWWALKLIQSTPAPPKRCTVTPLVPLSSVSQRKSEENKHKR